MRAGKLIFSALLLSTMAMPALADKGGSCHFHGSKAASETVVVGCADARRDTLLKNGKLHTSWKAIKHDKLEQVDGKKGKEWKISYKNPASPEKDKQMLFMFFTLPGNFVAATHKAE